MNAFGSINKVILIGTLGKDPEIRYSASGFAVGNFSLATNHTVKNKETGEWMQETEWHKIVVLGKIAETAGQYLRKGSKVYVEGRLQTNKWQDKNGNNRSTIEILTHEMHMLGGRSDNNAPANNNYNQSNQGNQPVQTAPQQNYNTPAPAVANIPQNTQQNSPQNAPPIASTDFDDEIPF
jgi:single-strand DNA-binding protein